MDKKPEIQVLSLIQTEVNSFYDFCRESGITEEEINAICKPLNNMITKAKIKNTAKSTITWLLIVALFYVIYESETVKWHGSAIGRIILIKLLPVWNWKPLYSQQCLVEKTQEIKFNEAQGISCVSCETIKSVRKISATTYNEIFYKFLIRGEPVVVTDAYERWYTYDRKLNFTEFLNENEVLSDSVPCRLQTNLLIGRQPTELYYVFTKITKPEVDNWFLHFQNCNLNAVKSLRVLAPRPYFLSPHIPPSHFNWLILSKNYESTRFKQIELDLGLVMMNQLQGTTKVLLAPKTPCADICEEITFDLEENETLVLANSLWDFYYIPVEGENAALISETVWNET